MSDTSVHRLAWDQIPWIVNGSLSETERLVVESHLQACADCREEFEFQRLQRCVYREETYRQSRSQRFDNMPISQFNHVRTYVNFTSNLVSDRAFVSDQVMEL